MPTRTDIKKLSSDFESCRKILCAIGDENQQHLILAWKENQLSGVFVYH